MDVNVSQRIEMEQTVDEKEGVDIVVLFTLFRMSLDLQKIVSEDNNPLLFFKLAFLE